MQQKNLDSKSSDDKKLNLEGMPLCIRDFFVDVPVKHIPKEKVEQGKKAIAEFLKNNKTK